MWPGDQFIPFELRNCEGEKQRVELAPFQKGLLILFLCNHCPYVHHYAARIRKIVSFCRKEGILVFGINSNDASRYPEDAPEHMPAMAEKLGLEGAYLHDAGQKIARQFRAERTPEAFLFNPHGNLVYRGAIDDQAKAPQLVKSHYLEDALKAVLNNDMIQNEYEPPAGCSIKWKIKNER